MTDQPASASPTSPVLAIVGPTAVGKTDVAVHVARQLKGEIISADSMAVYQGLDIGTAKPPHSVRQEIPFHIIDVVPPTELFNAGLFAELGRKAIAECQARGRLPIVAGGTGLYIRALLDGISLCGVPADRDLRRRLLEQVNEVGAPALHRELATIDPEWAAKIHPNDAVRIVRCLEVYRLTGLTMSEIARREAEAARPIPAIQFGLRMPMALLDLRINARVEAMFQAGWISEVAQLLASGVPEDAPGMRALGYRDIVAYLRGNLTWHECVDRVKKSTRRYARRQMTWFRADHRIQWIDVTNQTPEQTAAQIVAMCKDHSWRTTAS